MRTPEEWYEKKLKPAFEDYLSDPTSEHKAEAAVNAVAHFDETAYTYLKHSAPERLPGDKTKGAFRDARDQECPELTILRDVANARKHGELTRKPDERWLQFATDVYIDEHGGVIGGKINRELPDVLEPAVRYWHRWIEENPVE